MSHKHDRERARNGLLFRDGKYVPREELAKYRPDLKGVSQPVETAPSTLRVRQTRKPRPKLEVKLEE